MRRSFLALALLSLTMQLFAKNYYVAKTGSDSLGDGSSGAPFLTIQKAATLMTAGDICYIGKGTYRETVKPAHSGSEGAMITFTAQSGEEAIISGCDSLSGWQKYSGDIYRCKTVQNISQLFVDGIPATEARFPNTGNNLFTPATIPINMTETEVTSEVLNQPEGFWTGAKVWAMIGLRWVAQSAEITASIPGKLTIQNNTYAENSGKGIGFITGIFGALDTAGEWFQKPDSLYYQCNPADIPGNHFIEGKSRDWGIDLSGKNYISIKGIKTFGGGINMDRSNHCCIDGVNMKYLSHFVIPKVTWSRNSYTTINSQGIGIGIFGSYDTVRNSEIAWSAGDGITFFGKNGTIANCTIHDCNYSGTDCNPISGMGDQNIITRNTVYNGGRELIFLMIAKKNNITYNNIYNCGLINWDVGGIDTWGTDGDGTVIAYNWVHDIYSGGIDYQTANGIYIDNYCANFIVHHNVIWNCIYNAFNYSRPAKNLYFYNNTAFDCKNIDYSYIPDGSEDTSSGNQMYNNLITFQIGNFNALEKKNNIISSDIQLADPDHYDFRLKSGAKAIDAGISIPGITDNFLGVAPDAGAYEFGGFFWKAGAGTTDTVPVDVKYHLVGNHADCHIPFINAKSSFNRIRVNLQIPVSGIGSLALLRLDGRIAEIVYSGKFDNKAYTFDLRNHSRGNYLIRLTYNNHCYMKEVFLR